MAIEAFCYRTSTPFKVNTVQYNGPILQDYQMFNVKIQLDTVVTTALLFYGYFLTPRIGGDRR